MSNRIEAMRRLQRLAQLKSDIEMRRFSAYRSHVAATQGRINEIQSQLQSLYHGADAFSVEEGRLTNALAGDRSRALLKAEAELRQLLPGFEVARQKAVREFGRVQVLDELRNGLMEERKKSQEKQLSQD